MNPNLTELVYIIDRSGSMCHLIGDVVGGYNAFIEEQKKLSGEAYLTTVLFDDKYELFCDHTDIRLTEPMTAYDCRARGSTALMDAIGKTINSIGARLANTPEDQRPSKVLFMIMTDGYENSSKEFTMNTIKKMIEHQQNIYSWQFLFVGAGIDAYDYAASIGISKDFTASAYATRDCVTQTFSAFSKGASSIRCSADDLLTGWKNGIHEQPAVSVHTIS